MRPLIRELIILVKIAQKSLIKFTSYYCCDYEKWHDTEAIDKYKVE